MEFEFCKLEIYLPESHLEAVQQALWSVDAGHIGRYDCCLSYSPVIGAWRPLAGTAPYLGRMGEVCHAPELKVEVTCRTDRVEETVAAVKRAHPYEEPVINVIPLYRTGLSGGARVPLLAKQGVHRKSGGRAVFLCGAVPPDQGHKPGHICAGPELIEQAVRDGEVPIHRKGHQGRVHLRPAVQAHQQVAGLDAAVEHLHVIKLRGVLHMDL